MNRIFSFTITIAKNIIHRSKALETLGFTLFGLITLIRAHYIFKKIQSRQEKIDFTVIIHAVRTFPVPGSVYLEALLAHAFKKLGCSVKMLFHDSVLDGTDAGTIMRSEQPQNITSRLLGRIFKKALHIETISYRDFLSISQKQEIHALVSSLKAAELETYEYLGVKVGLHARASTIRYFLVGIIDLLNADHVSIFRKKLTNAIISAHVASKMLQREKPSVVLTLHGVYSTWGPFLDYFSGQGIDTVIYGLMTCDFGHLMFCRNVNVSELNAKASWEKFKQKPLSKEEEAWIDAYYKKRFSGDSDEQSLYTGNYDASRNKKEILASLQNPSYIRRYIMYPNLAWDTAIAGNASHLFNDIFSWIDKVVEFFKQNQSYQLIIKPHPAELTWEKGTYGIQDYIATRHGHLPKNITTLPPNTPLNAYELITKDSVGIVFNGTLGLELALLGIPTLLASKNIHYNEAGVTYAPQTMHEYLTVLDDPTFLTNFAHQHQNLAKKYAYFLYAKSIIRIPLYRSDKWSTLDWTAFQNIDALLSNDGNIIKVCEKIIHGEDIVNPL